MRHRDWNFFVRVISSSHCDKTCVCNGGTEQTCQGCHGNYISWIDGSHINIDYCPHHKNHWTLEQFINNIYGHYANGHLYFPLNNTPSWVADATQLLSSIKSRQDAEQKAEDKSNRPLWDE